MLVKTRIGIDFAAFEITDGEAGLDFGKFLREKLHAVAFGTDMAHDDQRLAETKLRGVAGIFAKHPFAGFACENDVDIVTTELFENAAWRAEAERNARTELIHRAADFWLRDVESLLHDAAKLSRRDRFVQFNRVDGPMGVRKVMIRKA